MVLTERAMLTRSGRTATQHERERENAAGPQTADCTICGKTLDPALTGLGYRDHEPA
jgi:hypothetical protein